MPTTPASAAAPADGLDSELELVDLASSAVGSYQRYRIPALTSLPNGDLLAVFDGRPTMNDLPSPIGLVARRSTDRGATWGEPQIVRQSPAPIGHGDPSIIVDRHSGDIFVFHASGVNAGFWQSSTGSDHDDLDVQQLDYSRSSDNGHSWTHHRITADLKKGRRTWAGMFASSGEGIQIRAGRYAGRLVQQYVLRCDDATWAVSAYSDDHGQTWQAGEPVGPGADENKCVDLADGTLLLISRAAPHRLVAHSSDGGQTWSPLVAHPQLPDPANNGTVIRAYPEAEADDPRSRWLLHINTASPLSRHHLTLRLSRDNGTTWPVSKVIQSGSTGYATLTALPGTDGTRGGSYGVFYERDGYSQLSYVQIDLDWLEREPNSSPFERVARSGGLSVLPVIDAIHPLGEPGFIDDKIQAWVEVVNHSDRSFTEVTLSAEGQTAPVLAVLAPGQSHTWLNEGPHHLVTAADLAAGSWVGRYTVTALDGDQLITVEAAMAPVYF